MTVNRVMALYRFRDSDDVLTAPQARTLAALIRVYARVGRATVRDVQEEAGDLSPSSTHRFLLQLVPLGLVTWEPETAGTLRPRVWPTKKAG